MVPGFVRLLVVPGQDAYDPGMAAYVQMDMEFDNQNLRVVVWKC